MNEILCNLKLDTPKLLTINDLRPERPPAAALSTWCSMTYSFVFLKK